MKNKTEQKVIKYNTWIRKKQKTTLSHKIMDEVIIDVKDVYKSFRVYYDKGGMLKERFVNPGRSRYEEREVLKGISFVVHRGETVALIGQNGCGKSTTLKMLTKILYPNKGTVDVYGKVSSLIELGAGFHPDMSGRENIYINASILGLKRNDVDRRIDEIIRFSELEAFIDNPIRTYSSGMYMRLAFSVAINVDADILLIDEILAVGDQAFQEKCIRKLDEQRQKGVTVVLVSHSMGQVKEIADRCIWIENGRIVEDGKTTVVCDHYEKAMTERREYRDEVEDRERRKEEQLQAESSAETVDAGVVEDTVEPGQSDKKADRRKERQKKQLARSEIKKQRQKDFSKRWKGGGSDGIPLLGAIGMLLVMLCHAAQDIYGIGYDEITELTFNMKLAGYTLFSVGRVGIPVLLILLGFSLLSRDYSTREKRFGYFKSFVLPAVITWEIWVLFYQWFLHVWIGKPFDLLSWIREALLIQYTDMSHAWFGRMFMIMLVLIPYLANVLQWMNAGLLRMLMLIIWVFIFLFPGFDQYGMVNGGAKSIPDIPGTVCYVFYLCAGYMLSLYVQRILRGSREVLILVLMLVVTVVSQLVMDNKKIPYLIWYTYYGVSLMAVFGFDIAVRLRADQMKQSLRKMFKEVFAGIIGIYLIHRPVQMILGRYIFLNGRGFLGGASGMFALRTVLLCVVSFVISAAIVYVLGRIPVVGKYLAGECREI